MLDGDVGGEVLAEAVGEGADVDVHFALTGFFGIGGIAVFIGRSIEEGLGEFFRGAHGELAADDLIGGEELGILILDGKNGFGMANGEAALGDEQLHIAVEIEQAHGIGDAGAGLADTAGDLVLFEGEFLGKAHVAFGFFHGIEVLALEVLDEGHLEHIAVGGLTLDDGHGGESEFAGSTPAAFAGDELELAIHGAHDERLDDAVLADGLDEVVQRGFAELEAWLQGTGHHHVERDIAHALEILRRDRRVERGCGCAFADECAESFSECLFRHGGRSITQSRRQFQADFPRTSQHLIFPSRTSLTRGAGTGIHCAVTPTFSTVFCAVTALVLGIAAAQPEAAPPAAGEAEVMNEIVPPEVAAAAVAAVGKLGDEVVLGRYQAALDRMNPLWKERAAKRSGGMEALEKQLAGVAAQMVQQGISMISFKPQGQPRVYQVAPTKRKVRQNGVEVERLVNTKWLVLVPTATRFRIIREGIPKPLVIESIGFQVALADKGKNDWTFIDGAGLTTADLRSLFITLPQDMELPPIEKKEVR